MSVFEIDKNKNYTVMSNYHLRDKKLSCKAKGLLSFMLSLPEEWDYSIKGLCVICLEGEKAIRGVLKELEQNGYLYRERINGEHGYYDYDYYIFENPNDSPYYHKGYTVEGHTQDEVQINTNITNTKEIIDKDDKTEISSFFNEKEHNILTLELIERGFINKEDTQIFYYDKLFQNLLDEDNSYKELLTIIHYIVSRVINRNFNDEDGNLVENKFGYFKNAIISNIKKLNNQIDDLWGEEEYDWLNDNFER